MSKRLPEKKEKNQMQKNSDVKFEVLHLPPMNTNSVLMTCGDDCVIFDAWGRSSDWKRILSERGLKLRAIYSTHGHPDHISAAPALARDLDVDWFLNANDNFYVGNEMANSFLDNFGIPHIPDDYKRPLNLQIGTIEILPGVKMQIMVSPGHTPGGLMFYFPKYKVLLVGDTIFQDNIGRYDMPGGNDVDLFKSIHNLYDMNLDDDVYVVHGHGMETTIGWLKQNNPFFLSGKH